MRRLLKIKKAYSIIDKFKDARILVIGDLILDHFIWGNVRRISPEAPVPVVEVTSEDILLGGSANVVNNIHSLGGKCLVAGVAGRDEDGKKLLKLFKEKGIPFEGITLDRKRPTTIKTRVIAHNQQVVRFDREDKDKIEKETLDKVIKYVKKALKSTDLVIISDYAKGLITSTLMEETKTFASKLGKPIVLDPKVEHFNYYRGVTVVTPNNLEASLASGIDIVDGKSLHMAGEVLYNKLGCKALLITRGEHGMSIFESNEETHIPTVAREVYDVSGAGDTVVGVLGLALASGADFKEAAVLANYAAGIVVSKVGTATVGADEFRMVLKESMGEQ
ncbi:MAG: D-glycero-beta-D-manno-heptose-7-phosphate kinase [Thermodesulfobacteriota bacterium]